MAGTTAAYEMNRFRETAGAKTNDDEICGMTGTTADSNGAQVHDQDVSDTAQIH